MRRNNLLFLFLCTIGILSAQQKGGVGVNLEDQNYIKADLTVKGNAYIGTLLDSTIQSKLFPQYSLIVGREHRYLANPDLINLSTYSSSIISGYRVGIGLISNSIFNGTGSFDDVSAGSLISVSGTSSEVKGLKSSYVFGENNVLTNAIASFLVGNNNKIYQKISRDNFIAGAYNSVSDSLVFSTNHLLGRDSKMYSEGATEAYYMDNIIFANKSTIKTDDFTDNIIIGVSPSLKGNIRTSFIFGNAGAIDARDGRMENVASIGSYNQISIDSIYTDPSDKTLMKHSMNVGGYANKNSGATHSYIIGGAGSKINIISDRFGVPEYAGGIYASLNEIIIGGSYGNNIKGQSYGSVIVGGKGENIIDGNSYSTIIGRDRVSSVFQGETIIAGTPEKVEATTTPSGNPIGAYAEPTDRVFSLSMYGSKSVRNSDNTTDSLVYLKNPVVALRDGRFGIKFNYDDIISNNQSGINQIFQVNGAAYIKDGIVTSSHTYPDYVFEKYYTDYSPTNDKYSFASLSEVEKFIKENKHLPGVTPIGKLSKNGDSYTFNLNDLSIQSLEKIEELYLHTIEQQRIIDKQGKEIEELERQIRLVQESLK